MVPMMDVKLSIPVGLKLGLSLPTTTIFATAGALIPAVLGLRVADPVSKWLMEHSKLWNRFFTFIFSKTRTKHSKKFEQYGAIALFTLVAVPLPGSGPGVGALASFVFGVDYWKSVGLISLGTIASVFLFLAGSKTVFGFISLF